MLFDLLSFVKLLFIQVTISQCLPQKLYQNGQHFILQSPKTPGRCTRQTSALPAELAQTNVPTNGTPNPGILNTPCNRLPNGLTTNIMLQNSVSNNGLIPNIGLNYANNMPIRNIGLQNSPCNNGLANSLAAHNVLPNSLPDNELMSNINVLNNAINIPIRNAGLQNSPCDYGLPNSVTNNVLANCLPNNGLMPNTNAVNSGINIPIGNLGLQNNFAPNNILQNRLPLNMPGNGFIPNANGYYNAINSPVNSGLSYGNDVTFGNNVAMNNVIPNAYNGPLINSIPNTNNFQNRNLNTNNMPAARLMPNSNIPFANSVPNTNNLSPPNVAPLNMPGSLPVNNLVNNNILPVNNILQAGNVMLPNELANLPQNSLPFSNGFSIAPNNIFPNNNNVLVNNGCANLPQNNMQIANSLQNINNLPIANDYPNINCINNLPINNGISGFNNLPTNTIVNNGLPYASHNMPIGNNVQLNSASNINNPYTLSNNMLLNTFYNDLTVNNDFHTVNGIPNNELLNNNLLINNNLFTPNLPPPNWPCNNPGVNSAPQQNVLQNTLPPINIQWENQLGSAKDLASNLQIEGFGNLPLLNGLPIAGITETVTLLNTPCS